MYRDEMIVGRVSKAVRELTRKFMEEFDMDLADAFNEACREKAKKGSRLWKAWYVQDFRKYIPEAYCPEYLDFKKYPIEY